MTEICRVTVKLLPDYAPEFKLIADAFGLVIVKVIVESGEEWIEGFVPKSKTSEFLEYCDRVLESDGYHPRPAWRSYLDGELVMYRGKQYKIEMDNFTNLVHLETDDIYEEVDPETDMEIEVVDKNVFFTCWVRNRRETCAECAEKFAAEIEKEIIACRTMKP